MRTQRVFLGAAEFLLFVGFACAAAAPALAGGNRRGAENAPASRLTPGLERKAFTNEDLETLASQYGGPSTVRPSSAATSYASAQLQSAPSQVARRLVPPEKDPKWYAQQAGSLSAQAEAIDARVQRLRQFRATGTAAGVIVGLVLDASCEGITTDNEIQQLILQRAQIESRIVDLEDMARQNDISPGIFRESAASAQAALHSIQTSEEIQSYLIGRVQKLNEDVAQMQDVIQGMKDVAAARHVTLTPETRFGGGATADFLHRLAARESALREEAGAAEDDARHFGVSAGSLP
jgi:hypothetical protein